LRYDKRTYVYRNQLLANANDIDLNTEVLNDVASAIRQVDAIDGISEIFVLGHSLGGMLAPKIANDNHQVTGIIIMAGNARPLEELIWEQYNYLMQSNGIDKREMETLSTLKVQLQNLEKLKQNESDIALDLPLGLPIRYWQSLNEYKQIEEIKSVEVRILILQGVRDYQVTMEDYKLWKNALQNNISAEFRSYPKLNHLFMEGEGPSIPAEYQVKGSVPDYVIKDIAGWINLSK